MSDERTWTRDQVTAEVQASTREMDEMIRRRDIHIDALEFALKVAKGDPENVQTLKRRIADLERVLATAYAAARASIAEASRTCAECGLRLPGAHMSQDIRPSPEDKARSIRFALIAEDLEQTR